MFKLRIAAVAMICLWVVSLVPAAGARPAAAQTAERCFPETGHCISGRIRQYWEQNGGLPVFGFPIAPAGNEVNRDTGKTFLTQWFERNRLEVHPENKAPYDVLLGRLGDDMLRAQGRNWQAEGRESGPKQGCLWFAETGHNVCNQAGNFGLRSYWSTNGLEFDGRAGKSYQESLALFGLPLTEARQETNSSGDTVLTQWFERARIEWHPEQQDPTYRVLLGLLGTELRGPVARVSLPTNVPWVHNGNQLFTVVPGGPSISLAQKTEFGGPWQVVAAPNGARLAYVENLSASNQQLVILNAATGERRSYPAGGAGANVFGMVFSPDGQQLAYTTIFSGQQTYYELRVVDVVAGTSAVRLTERTQLVPVPETWNASGLYARVIYYQSDAPVQGLLQIDPKTGAVQKVVEGSNYGVAVSPNGRSVAVVTGEAPVLATPKTQLAVRDRTTGQAKTIVPMGAYLLGNVQWSADGTKVAFARYFENVQGAESVRVMNADGTGEQVLRLDTGAFPGILLDFKWRGNALLLLTQDGPGKLSVFEVPLSNFHPAAAKTLHTFEQKGEFGYHIVYVPR